MNAAFTLFLASLSALALSYSKDISAAPAGTSTSTDVRQLAQQTVTKYRLNVDASMLVAMAYIESGFKPNAFRAELAIGDASVGLMQTLLGTAREMYDRGYKAFSRPTMVDLRKPEVSMYFGAAYVDYLKQWYGRNRSGSPSEEWIVRAYNGGPGWERGSASSLSNTANHWRKYQDAKRRFG